MKPTPNLAAVIGHPIGHSLSPAIHNFWARREQIASIYVPIETTGERPDFFERVEALRKLGFRGANVTLPHKVHALEAADQQTDRAQTIGAANMLSFTPDGVIADNSDAEGFAAPLRALLVDNQNTNKQSLKVLVIGAGGAARAVLYALSNLLGLKNISIMNRTPEKAEEIAPLADADVIKWRDPHFDYSSTDLFVNTTSIGMTGGPRVDFPIHEMKPGSIVCDIVYSPLKTPLLRKATEAGLATIDGLEMLMAQAAPGYQAWLGQTPTPDAALRTFLENELRRRDGA